MPQDPKQRRGRKKAPPIKLEGVTCPEELARLSRLARNRKAAEDCRERRRVRENELTGRVEELEQENKALREELLQTKAAMTAMRSTLELTTTQLLQATQQTGFNPAAAPSAGSSDMTNSLVATMTAQTSPVVAPTTMVAPTVPPCAMVDAEQSTALLAALASTLGGMGAGLAPGTMVPGMVPGVVQPIVQQPQKVDDLQQQLQAALAAAMLYNCS